MPGIAEEVVSPDEAAVVASFIKFIEETSARRHPTGTIKRFNQGRAAGCVDAELTVPADLPDDLRVGLYTTSHSTMHLGQRRRDGANPNGNVVRQ